jgi:broad specificity phosphatase PhoE
MILYLVRHGKSLANTLRLVTGTPTDVLHETGIAQAEMLGAWLKQSDIRPTHFVTSQWQRAQQTANIMWPDADWTIDPRVGETDTGTVADWTLEKFNTQYPGFFHRNDTKFPGGESHKDLYERVTGWLAEMLVNNKGDRHIMLVAHSGPISCLIQSALGLGWKKFPAYPPKHASLSILDFPKDGKAKLDGFSLLPSERAGE